MNIQESIQSENPDVTREREHVANGDYSPTAPLVICDLYKEYPRKPRPKVALNKLTLIVEEGECFGLLGENGAGKSFHSENSDRTLFAFVSPNPSSNVKLKANEKIPLN
jgi:ABC-type glutathione transport system ATPase component